MIITLARRYECTLHLVFEVDTQDLSSQIAGRAHSPGLETLQDPSRALSSSHNVAPASPNHQWEVCTSPRLLIFACNVPRHHYDRIALLNCSALYHSTMIDTIHGLDHIHEDFRRGNGCEYFKFELANSVQALH